MEQEQHQWTLHDHEEEEQEVEEEGPALERRKILQQSNDRLITGVVVSSSSSSSSSNGSESSEHVNGAVTVVKVNDQDGSLVEKEEEHAEMGSVCENGNNFDNDKADCAAVGLGIVAEFAEAETNEEAATGSEKNSVYFDKQQGMWKCRHCTWTKRFDGPLIQHGPCFVCETKGNEVNGVQNGDSAGSVLATNQGEREFDVQVEDAVIPNSLCNEVNNECAKAVNDKVPSSSELSRLHNSSDIQATPVMNVDDETGAKEGPNIIQEIEQQLKDYDVETVLAKQETHDLFCPNCNSCITKRVILKKRKRYIHTLDNKAKRDKLDAVVSSKVVDSVVQETNQGDQANVTPDIVSLEQPHDNNDPEREPPEVFRCLSCFSFFIPSGKRFNLFRNVGGARQHETSQNPSTVPASNLQNTSNAQGSNENWLVSLFTLKKGKTASEQGDASLEHSRTGPSEQHQSTQITSNVLNSTEIAHPEGPLSDTGMVKNLKPMPYTDHGHGGLNSSRVEAVKTEPLIENGIKSNMASGNASLADQNCVHSLAQNDLSSMQASTKGIAKDTSSTSFSDDMVFKHENVPLATATTTEILANAEEPSKISILNAYEGKPESLAPTTVESSILAKSPNGVDKTAETIQKSYSSLKQGTQPPAQSSTLETIPKSYSSLKQEAQSPVQSSIPETIQKSYSSLKQGTQSPVQSFGSAVLASDVASNKPSTGIDVIIQSKTPIQKVKRDIEEEKNLSDRKENEGGDVIVLVEGEEVDTISQTVHNVPAEGGVMTGSHTQTSIDEQPTAEIGEPKEWEILKSIVYGGLVESITSLGIVSSAASSGAAPLNIIALGLANLVGGFFILGHNLNELRNAYSRGDQQPTNDRYQELLGGKENFLLHVVVAVLSFLIFGSVPIVIYGVLINKNYYAEVKLAILAAASTICIILLAIGKVYTKRQPKSYIKTVSYYVILALATSGVSYIGGNLFKDLLEKFTQSESGFAITMPVSDANMKPAWMSY